MWPVGQAVKTPPFHGDNGGSIPPRVTKIKSGRLAQLGERLPYKQDVGSSILSSPTILEMINEYWNENSSTHFCFSYHRHYVSWR
jgi:hypothetical protein